MSPAYLANRIAQLLITLFVVSILAFVLLMLLPADPVTLMLGPDASLTQADIESRREQLGLNDPIPVQYINWLGRTVSGDFGTSVRDRRPVVVSIKERLPVTLQLTVLAWLVAIAVALPLGIVAALHRGTSFDRLMTAFAVGGVAMPSFFLAVLAILFFAVRLDWLPTSGFVPAGDNVVEWGRHLVLPVLVLGTAQAATIMRQTRSSMIEVLSQDYIRTARAKGLTNRAVVQRHALRNAMMPVVTILGLRLGHLFGGSVIVETVFALPGLGRLAIGAVFSQDFPIVMAFVVISGTAVPLAALVTDIAYGLLDPRIRMARA